MQIYSIKPSSKPNADFKVSNYMHSTPLQNLKTTLSPLGGHISYLKMHFYSTAAKHYLSTPSNDKKFEGLLVISKVNEKCFLLKYSRRVHNFVKIINFSIQIFQGYQMGNLRND